MLIVTALPLYTTACRYKVDIQDLAIVMAMGVDYTDEGKYKVSYQMFTSSTFQGGSGEAKGEAMVMPYFQGFGMTLTEAMHDMEERLGKKKLHFGQLKVIIIGQKAGAEGISLIIDALARLSEIKTNIPIYATEGEAQDIIMKRASEDPITANIIDNMVLRQVHTGTQPVVYLAQIADKLSSKHNVVPIIGAISLPEEGKVYDSSSLELNGIAVFQDDKLLDFLDKDVALGCQYIWGDIKIITTPIKLKDGQKGSVQLQHCKSKIRTKFIDGKPEVYINIKIQSSLTDITGNMDFSKKPELLNEIEEANKNAIEKTVKETILTAKNDVKLDFIGFGDMIYKQHPKEFEKIKDKWEEIFIELPIKVTVEVEIKDTGLLRRPI